MLNFWFKEKRADLKCNLKKNKQRDGLYWS